MLAMFLVLLIAVGNFALGFALAVQFGHGPAWAHLPGRAPKNGKDTPAAKEPISLDEASH